MPITKVYERSVRVISIGLIVLIAITACSSQYRSGSTTTQAEAKPSAIPDANALCARLAEIKTLPHKDEAVNDPAYNNLRAAGLKVLPCLIKKISDTTSMKDPRSAPGYTGVDNKVGDVALWVLCDITGLSFVRFLPPNVQEDYKEEGVLAYFKYVQAKENREVLQSKLEQWYREKYGQDATKP